MPLTPEVMGSNADGSQNTDYCYKSGAFVGEMTMEQMISFCVPGMVEHNEGMTAQKPRALMAEVFPQLKRGRQN